MRNVDNALDDNCFHIAQYFIDPSEKCADYRKWFIDYIITPFVTRMYRNYACNIEISDFGLYESENGWNCEHTEHHWSFMRDATVGPMDFYMIKYDGSNGIRRGLKFIMPKARFNKPTLDEMNFLTSEFTKSMDCTKAWVIYDSAKSPELVVPI